MATAVGATARMLDKGNAQFFPSPQQLVDCATTLNYGCDGGFPATALAYVTRHGMARALDYP